MIKTLLKKELTVFWKSHLIFILTISFSLIILASVQSLGISIDSYFKSKAKELLSSDFSISARRSITDEELETLKNKLPKIIDSYQVLETYTMAQIQERSRLVQLKVVEANYPFYGKISYENESNKVVHEDFDVYPSIDLKNLEGLELEQKIKIGSKDFQIKNFVTEDESSSLRGIDLAARVYLRRSDFLQTNLLVTGSVVTHSWHFKLSRPLDSEEYKSISKIFEDPGLSLKTPEKSSESFSRSLTILTDFLALASMIGFLLACFGLFFLWKGHLERRKNDLKILKTLGVKVHEIKEILNYKLLSLLSISFLLSLSLLPLVLKGISSLIYISLDYQINLAIWNIDVLLALIVPLVFIYILLADFKFLSKLKLNLHELRDQLNSTFSFSLIRLSIFLGFFTLSSMYVSKSYLRGGLFTLVLILLYLLSLFLFFLLKKLIQSSLFDSKSLGPFLFKRSFLRENHFYKLSFIVLFFLASFMSLILQLEHSLKLNLATDKDRPSLFLFDIQEDQKSELEKWSNIHGYDVKNYSPLVRSRILKINNIEFEKELGDDRYNTREDETRLRLKNRTTNLSYRDNLMPNETIIEGQWRDSKISADQISIEKRFAQRLGIQLGDKLTFDVQGVEVEGIVTSIRHIRWTSFIPNFFIVFQNGVLEMAPQIFLASFYSLDEEEKTNFQNQLVKNFPTISVIDLDQTVKQLNDLVSQVLAALFIMTLLVLVIGMIILSSLVYERIHKKKTEFTLLKVLGLSQKHILSLLFLDFTFIGLSSLCIGGVSGGLISILIAHEIFDALNFINFHLLFLVVFSIFFIFTILSIILTVKIYKSKNRQLFLS